MTPARFAELLQPYLEVPLQPEAEKKLLVFLELLLRWNAKTNLTAIRDPETLARRQFGESLFCARYVPERCETLLDYGSGAGFPGLPIAIARPDIRLTLAESQGKKSAFLREAVRTMTLPNVQVWADRVESLPPDRRFNSVTMRAVDKTDEAQLQTAKSRLTDGGCLLRFVGTSGASITSISIPATDVRLERTFHVEHC